VDALDLLTGDAQTFRDKVWASQVLLHHTDPDRLVRLLSLDDVDELLTSSALRTPTVRVVQDGMVLPSTRFTRPGTVAGQPLTGLVDPRKVLDLFDGGATVVLQGLHRYWPPLTRLVRALELELGHRCQANAYLTPPGSQGFARHSDTHDVFVFQTDGCKQWEVVDEAGQRDVLLEPGLVMYLPAGTPHSARSENATSLHVTVGINRVTWREVLRRLTDEVLAEATYDEPLPAGYLEDRAALRERLAERVETLTRALRAVDAGDLASQHVTSFLSERTPVLRRGLTDRTLLASLDQDSVVERRPTTACELRPEGEKVVVLLGDRALRMPARLTEVMTFVRGQESFRIGDLEPWLDPESRLVVVRRLVREGLLRIVE